ncbi:MAG: SpoIIE family protein phosphatase [Draconibacterium sp.]|nr:SpoIIE family protein phosphatase [Draconibacterium sp.]
MPLGLYPNRTYEESKIKLKPGDTIILYSDGVTEQQGTDNENFGIERLFQVLKNQLL